MNSTQLAAATTSKLPFEPNDGQRALICSLSAFVTASQPRDVFILNGYAGTGKTSVMGALVSALADAGISTVILAPTGRAAKVASRLSAHPASTIHKRLYRGNSLDPGNTQFFIAENRDRDTVFIIDEASMVTDGASEKASLLFQLLRHIYSAPGCRAIFVGDTAQLPPVGMSRSMAMIPDRFRQLGLNPVTGVLEVPVRQAADSGILYNATTIRHFLYSDYPPENFTIYASGFEDVEIVNPIDLAEQLQDSWREVGASETLIITRSNKRANNFNRAVRNMVMYAEEPLQQGDLVVVTKNDYYWSRINKLGNFIANGETASVTWVGHPEKAYGRWFCDVELKLADVEAPVAAKVMMRSLVAEGPTIPREEMDRFFNHVLAEYDGELSHKLKGVGEDPYFNALHLKHAYCVTCHKAQGGQWKHVYIDMGAIPMDAIGPDFYRWLYTAVTRASEKLFFINPGVNVE